MRSMRPGFQTSQIISLNWRLSASHRMTSMTSAQERKIKQTGCDARFDNLTRQLYATDASIYQIEPVGVAFPKSAQQASLVIRAAADAGLSVTPRGAGTSLVGNAIGEGLIVDFSRHNRQITDLDLENRSVRVGAGVVLDQLNDFLKPHGFCFGPDVATSSRATLGGMIANNSSGARCPDLRNDSRPCSFARNRVGRWSRRKYRPDACIITQRTREDRGSRSRSEVRDGRALAAGLDQTLAGLRHRAVPARAE